jgi:DNA polymerase-3 subunit alpha/error-prone DNA polymerase
MFSHLQVRSAYSFLSGPRRVEELVARARELGYAAMALTDIDNLYGVHAFLEAAGEAGIRPIIGAELTTAGGSVVALVKDREGFGNLCELITARKAAAPAGATGAAGAGAVPDLLPDLARLSGGLVYASYAPSILASLAGRVGELYAALSPRRLGAVPAARRLGLPLLALGDAAFLEPGDHAIHRLLKAIGANATLGGLDPGGLDDPASLLFGPGAAEGLFASWPEALAATARVAEECRFSRIFEGFVFPDHEAADGDGAAEPGGAEGAWPRLRRLTFQGAERRWGELCDAIVDRLEYELGLIRRKGFTDYFLVVAEIAGFTGRTCGRGSGAASAVAYSLGITNVDPIRHHLWFERFLNESRPDPPDIDIDFAWDERDGVLHEAIERFGGAGNAGEGRVARVANHLSFRPRSALREAAKAYGIAEGEIAACARAVFDGSEAGDWEAKPLWSEILPMARAIEGLPRGLSMHCGGLVIAPGPIRRFAPIESSLEGYPLLQWEKDGTEAAGLVKIDLLGNRSLAVIRDALANLAAEGIHVEEGAAFERMALGDRATEEMLASGDTMGVFYIESPAMRQLQKKARVGDYDHIVIHSSIIRPAANKFITEYVKRLHGEPWEELHPLLDKVLDETYGILCYQEDVSKAAMALAGFDECDADALRKILAKKNKAAKLAEFHDRFFAGCAARGVGEEVAASVWEMMESFSGYSFCKPHSASYAVVSFQSAWLRRHHPAEFMAAVLSNQGGFYTPSAYVSEARRMGLTLRGPDVNESGWKYHGVSGAGAPAGLVIGLMAVAGLGKASVEAIIAERERGGPFRDIPSFCRRMERARGLEEGELLALVEAGALDSISGGAARTEQARTLLCARDRGGRAAAPGLFDGAAGGSIIEVAHRASGPGAGKGGPGRGGLPGEAAGRAALEAEYRVLGFLRDLHPLELWRRQVDAVDRVLVKDLGRRLGSFATIVCLPVTRKEVLTGGGEDMAFVSLEDETGITEAVLFPEAYGLYARLLYEVRPLVVSGRVEDDMGAVSFEIGRISLLRDLVPRGAASGRGHSPLPGKMGPVLPDDSLGVLPHGPFLPERRAEPGKGGGLAGGVGPASGGGPGGPDKVGGRDRVAR